MAKITIHATDETVTLKLAGALIGPWVDELQACLDLLQANRQNRTLRVDVTGLTNISPLGNQLLGSIERDGGVFVSGNRSTDRFVGQRARRALERAVTQQC